MDRKKAKIQNDISELQNKINDFNGKISALQSIREELLEKQYITKLVHGNIPKLTGKDFRNITIPIPPLFIQRKLVQTLDRFDALCNDLTSGLPAEIAARQKQYEYYRDKLLSFPERS